MNTDYNLYKIFLYLFEEKSISKTANKLYVSQPAISYSLKELESQLGYTLFYRNSKGIEPTMEAKELYNYISTAFTILKDAEEHIKNLNNLNTGCIRIGIPSYLGSFYLVNTITAFREEYPGIHFEIVSESIDKMLEMLETRKLDVVFDLSPIDTKKSISKIVLSKLKNCFVYHKNKVNITSSKIEDILKGPMILPGKNSSLRTKFDEYVEDKNISVDPVVEAWNSDMLLDSVRNGIGVGYTILNIVENEKDKEDFEIISADDLPGVEVCCCYMDEFLTAATKKFIEKVKSTMKK